MKKGFLVTEKAKRMFAAEADVPRATFPEKGKGKGKGDVETSRHTSESLHDTPTLDLHSLPPTIKSQVDYPKDKSRFIFRRWPRDPNGKVIAPSDIHGKEAANGLNLWGATLYDFYFVRRIPSNIHGLTISTGSKLAEVMKSFGELDHAPDELAWASREADPKEIPAWDSAQAVVAYEHRVHTRLGVSDCMNKAPTHSVVDPGEDVQMLDASEPASNSIDPNNNCADVVMDPDSEDCANESSHKPIDTVNDIKTQQPPSDILAESPFHPSNYPSPWPLYPFENSCPPFPLQRGLPIHLLPKKLYVHDPWKLLDTELYSDRDDRKTHWSSKTDRVLTYTLSLLSSDLQATTEAASQAAAAAEDAVLEIPQSVLILPRQTGGPTEQPAIRAFLPKRPRRPTEVPEAHLYLTPKGKLGIGNHSIVYEADLELPRDLFCESTHCKSCLDEQIKVEIDRLKESGEWERLLNEAVEKSEGQEYAACDAASSSSVQIPPRYVGFVKVRLEHLPMETMSLVAATELGKSDAPSEQVVRVSNSVANRHVEYEGLVVPVYPNIQWQNPSFPETLCVHQAGQKPVPRTATFRVAAKLSLPDDCHLAREAQNYLKFPAHFFQHWSGYNVIPPLHDPVPVSALVPQFFGYYAWDGAQVAPDKKHSLYRSAILLIEHCGKPINAHKLSVDDKHECAALLFRFHCAGWLHGSFAERNILMHKGHPTCSPLKEDGEPEKDDSPYRRKRRSFRLIDFGRSEDHKDTSQTFHEDTDAKLLFNIL